MTYFLKRIPSALFTIWLVATSVFFLVKLAGGEEILGEGRVDPMVIEEISREWKLDRPLHEQYWYHMSKLLVLDSVESRKQRFMTLRDVLGAYLPASLRLAWRALAIALAIGMPIGVLSALHHNRFIDNAGRFLSLLGVSVPSFILASLVIFVFVRQLNWFPASEWMEGYWRMWVPAACLAAFPFAAIMRLTRASMLSVFSEDYMRTATAKGVPAFRVVVRHGLRNALVPVVTYLGPVLAGLLTGSLVIEKIFSINGIGRIFIESVSNRDMPLIMGLTVFYCMLLVGANLLVDALYPILDPRIRHS
ncbi:MAG: ABC transporter permease [Candidatus Sumerlaeia bacterium]|nr:ABC transporter permease [Candidatus Sumerlaeia bacterium]